MKFRFLLCCLFSLLAAGSLSAQIAPACNPSFSTSCNGYRIYNFTYAGINNSPTAANCSVSNYLSQVATVAAGVPTIYSVQMGLWMNYAIYADFNNNGNFNDAGEMLYASGTSPGWNASGVLTDLGSLTVPASVSAGSYRLRLLGVWVGPALGATSACNTFNLAGGGNFHDYTLTVAPPSCTPPPVLSYKDSFHCGPGVVVLEATTVAGADIRWYANATGGIALATGNTFTTPSISTNTTYYIAAAEGTCESIPRQPVVASVRPVPSVNIGNDTSICPGVSYVLDATTANAGYAWNTGASTSSITVNAAGTYSVLVTVNGCGGSDARIITPGVVPVNNLPAATDLCEGETIALDAGNTGSTFLWTPGGAATQFINVSSGGIYSVDVSSTDGCMIHSSTDVISRPLPVAALGSDTSICDGDQIVLDAGNPGYTYTWSTGAATQSIAVTDSGTYTVVITSPYSCMLTENKHIAFLPAPRVEGFNFIPYFYEELGKVKFSPLNPTAVQSYEWDFGDGSPVSFQAEPLHIYAGSGEYVVTLKVFNDCNEYSTQLPINVNLTTGLATLSEEPEALTLYPNPVNRLLTIGSRGNDVAIEEVTVFNMLGAAVYRQKASNPERHQLSVGLYASGMYVVHILTNKGLVIRKFEISH